MAQWIAHKTSNLGVVGSNPTGGAFTSKGQWSSGMIPALGAGGRGFDSPLAPFTMSAFLAQMVERWPFKPMVVGSIPTEGVPLLVGVVGNISACHADARGSIPRRGARFPR